MELQTRYDKYNNLRSHSLVGKVDIKTLADKLKAIYESPDLATQTNVIWDIAAANLTGISERQIGEFANFVNRAWGDSKDYRAAFVVGSEYNFGVMRMFKESLDLFRVDNIRCFDFRVEALQWVIAER